MFLDEVAFEGMKVVMKMDKEARYWGRKGPPDGSTGVLLARKRYTFYSSRFGNDMYFREPGVYERDGTWYVKMDDPSQGDEEFQGIKTGIHLGSQDFDVHPDSQKEYEERAEKLWYEPVRNKENGFVAQEAILNKQVKISDLPETIAWELDEIVPDVDDLEFKKYRYIVNNINYMWENGPFFDVSAVDDEGKHMFSTSFRHDKVKEVIRGNLWKYEHGIPLEFRSIEEEASFQKGLGKAEEIRNPNTGNFHWELEEFLDAVRDGIVDCMTNGIIPFTDTRSISAYRFEDRSLGERLREKTIEGFGINSRMQP